MKRLLVVLLALAAPAFAEYYSVLVSRVAENLYRLDDTCDKDGCLYVRTRWCSEYPVNQRAILEYDENDPWSDDRLLFEKSGKTCDVIELFQGGNDPPRERSASAQGGIR